MTSFDVLRMNFKNSKIMTARIFNIQRYSLHDGKGIRTVVFFKGCPLSCPWCANPESRSYKSSFMRSKALCLNCDTCELNVDECPSGAYQQLGKDMTLDEVLVHIAKDDVFFETSKGGITLSGGEVLSQAPFAIALLRKLKQLGYRTAIETSGHGNTKQLSQMASLCDEILFDLKIMDAQKAKQVIGINIEKVLKNFTILVEQGCHLIPRLPLISGYTLDLINVQKILNFLSQFSIKEIHLLPFHQYGASKYETLNMEYLMKNTPTPNKCEIEAIANHFRAQGYEVVIEG